MPKQHITTNVAVRRSCGDDPRVESAFEFACDAYCTICKSTRISAGATTPQRRMKMFCQSCGAQVSGAFCTKCGAPAGQPSHALSAHHEPPPAIQQYAPAYLRSLRSIAQPLTPAKSGSGLKILFVMLAGLAVLAMLLSACSGAAGIRPNSSPRKWNLYRRHYGNAPRDRAAVRCLSIANQRRAVPDSVAQRRTGGKAPGIPPIPRCHYYA